MIPKLQRSIPFAGGLFGAALALLWLTLSPSPALAASGGEEVERDETPWWNEAWTVRKKLEIAPLTGAAPEEETVALLRLHGGNFLFANAKPDGSDIRLVYQAEADSEANGDEAEEAKEGEEAKSAGGIELPYHLERWDALMNEAFLWVRLPALKTDAPTKVFLYYGNAQATPAEFQPEDTFGDDARLVYHFTEGSGAPRDFTGNDNSPEEATTVTEGALIGPGVILFGTSGLTIPGSDSLAWTAGAEVTLSSWIKPTALGPDAVLVKREENGNAFVLGVNDGVPYVEITDGAGTARTSAGEPISTGSWRQLAVVSTSGKTDLYLDGDPYGTVAKGMPALASPVVMGSTPAAGGGFAGEVDEFRIHARALPAPLLKFQAINASGSDQANQLIVMHQDESAHGGGGHNETLEHVMLFGDIAKNMMFDGWIAVGVCVLMIFFGWGVAIRKFIYLNSIQKGSDAFTKLWHQLSTDLTALDVGNGDGSANFGGKVGPKAMRNIRRSPLYHIYHIGSEEIRRRVSNGKGLSGRSIQAIRASLETGLVKENQRMNSGLIFLTISIAGGPYVGLLGTVVGVMITFAIIAKSGEVDVNSIAPGIASALLATVAGLVVAIPALFIYSYLNSRIKGLIAGMKVFIDEFIAKMAEFYPPPGEDGGPVSPRTETKASNAPEADTPPEREPELVGAGAGAGESQSSNSTPTNHGK